MSGPRGGVLTKPNPKAGAVRCPRPFCGGTLVRMIDGRVICILCCREVS